MLFSIQLAVRSLPLIGRFDECGISVLANEFHRLSVFLVLVSAFIVETVNYAASKIIQTISAGLEAPVPKAAQLHPALGLGDVPFPVFIAQLATATDPACVFTAGFAIRAATAYFLYRHNLPELDFI